MFRKKPLGRKNYGSIPHLPNSRMGPADKSCHKGQWRIACKEPRDKHDEVIVTEKIDGSNVGVAKKDDHIFPLTRAGYIASSSPYLQHLYFSHWVYRNYERFWEVLDNGERIVGEWMLQAHGTKYTLEHEPFVAFDIMVENERMLYNDFLAKTSPFDIVTAGLVHRGNPISVEDVMDKLGEHGYHGATEQIEGAVWRIERNKIINNRGNRKRVVDFLVKWVRPDKVDGKYLDEDIFNQGWEKYIEVK